MAFSVRHITRTINAEPGLVAAFAGDPANLPLWAEGLSAGIRNENGRWITDSPMGTVEVKFTGQIAAGILDHDVILPDGTIVHNPFRVLRNDDVAEAVFTLYRLPGTADEAFERDAALISSDLVRLQNILESGRDTLET